MIPFFRRLFRAFFWNPDSFQASLRSLITFVAASAATVMASASDATGQVNLEVLGAWGWKEWGMRLGVGAVMGYALRLRAGDKNPAPPPAQP